MKLSQFKIKKSKSITFTNGAMEEENKMYAVDGKVEFFELDKERLLAIQKEIGEKVSSVEDDELLFEYIPFMSNIEVDITLEDFREMLASPTKEFASFMKIIVENIADLFDMLEDIDRIEQNTIRINEKVSKLSTLEQPKVVEMTREEKLEILYNNFALAKDNKDERNKIMKEILELSVE